MRGGSCPRVENVRRRLACTLLFAVLTQWRSSCSWGTDAGATSQISKAGTSTHRVQLRSQHIKCAIAPA